MRPLKSIAPTIFNIKDLVSLMGMGLLSIHSTVYTVDEQKNIYFRMIFIKGGTLECVDTPLEPSHFSDIRLIPSSFFPSSLS